MAFRCFRVAGGLGRLSSQLDLSSKGERIEKMKRMETSFHSLELDKILVMLSERASLKIPGKRRCGSNLFPGMSLSNRRWKRQMRPIN